MIRISMHCSLVLLLSTAVASVASRESQGGRRLTYGKERAAQLEAITQKLFPGAHVEWEPDLKVRAESGVASPLDVIGFLTALQSDGAFQCVLAFEVGDAKQEHIATLKRFRPAKTGVPPANLVVARLDAAARVIDLHRVPVTWGEAVTRLETLDVFDWRAGGWPLLRLHYVSYLPGEDSLATIEWDVLLESQTGSFQAKLPTGFTVETKKRDTVGEIFSFRRTGANEIEITGAFTKKVIKYVCSEPCVVDSSVIVREWIAPIQAELRRGG